MVQKGSFVISLDFELLWGIIEKNDACNYAESNVKNVPIVIERMISLFEKYNVKATFATVGFVMCEDKEEASKYFPYLKPTYDNKSIYPYEDYFKKINNQNKNLYFAADIIKKLKESPNIEIGTHTFCHYYCWEKGQTLNQFEDDINSAIKLANDKNICLKSIVFPRNEISDEYLRVCLKFGLSCFRGNPKRFFSNPKNRYELYKNRFLRLVDTYIPIFGKNSYKYEELNIYNNRFLNIPASRYFRPYSHFLSLLEPIRMYRMKREMYYSAQKAELYHLWWHPHNFGADIDKNLNNLEEILIYFNYCREKYGMQSYTMNELSELILNCNE